MTDGFDSDALIRALTAAANTRDRFDALTQGLSRLGLDIVNYGIFDLNAAELLQADIRFLTTMSDGWMDYYYDQDLAASDSHVIRVRQQKITPYIWDQSMVERLGPGQEQKTAREGAEAGLVSGIFVPLTDPLNPFRPVAGIGMASSMGERDFRGLMAEHGATLVSIAHMFHNASIRHLWYEQSGGQRLSARERDCLQYLADGRRQDAIADAMRIARVTVEAHLRSARQKLKARTLNEAVAKALVFGEITRA